MTDKFSQDNIYEIKPSCATCIHRSKILSGSCLAFPEGIPMEILTGKNDHKKPFDGDNGIQFEAIK